MKELIEYCLILNILHIRWWTSDLRDLVCPDQFHHSSLGFELLLREDLRQDPSKFAFEGDGQGEEHEEAADADVVECVETMQGPRRRYLDDAR
jgi:hypothetical protein